MTDVATDLARDEDLSLETYRTELTGYCYRMLGSSFEAEDAVQEAMVRAWRGLDAFEGRSTLRSWLYRIATNVCLDLLNARNRRALPMDMSATASQPVLSSLGEPLADTTWVEPALDSRVLADGDPADVAVSRDSVRLAFVAALQHLPPRQRAVLILRDVLRWKADEVAELLEASVASVNSALQRARATLASRDVSQPGGTLLDDSDRDLLARYVSAFERYDISSLVKLLHEDATMSMPPYPLWLQGTDDIAAWLVGPGHGCEGSLLIPLAVNGSPGFAQYRPDPGGGPHVPFSVTVLEVVHGRVARTTHFLDTRLFALFDLPATLTREQVRDAAGGSRPSRSVPTDVG